MMQVGSTMKAPFNARVGDVFHKRYDDQTFICRTEERREGLVLVVTGACQDTLQSKRKQA